MGKNSTRARARAARDGRSGRHSKGWDRDAENRKAMRSKKEKRLRNALEVDKLPRNQIVRGAVVWAWVPNQEDPCVGKSRPVIVVTVDFANYTVEVIPITTARARGAWWGRRSLDWVTLGLSRPGSATRRILVLPWESLTLRYSLMPETDVATLEKWARLSRASRRATS